MDDIAVITVADEQVPKDLETLKALLIENGLEGNYIIDGEFLRLDNEDGNFEFNMFPSTIGEQFGMGPGIEISADFGDEVAVLIELQEVLESVFPGGDFSSAYDE